MKRYFCLFFLAFIAFCSFSQTLPVLKSNKENISLRVDNTVYTDQWKINPALKPDVQNISVKDKPVLVAFISDVDSIGFMVYGGKQYDFNVLLHGKDTAFTRVSGQQFINPARFDKAYQAAHNGKNFVEIPEVYELINVIYALTPTAGTNRNIVSREGAYYKELIDWFEPYKGEPMVQIADSLLKADKYHNVKMDAYSLQFDRRGKILASPVYDRVSWGAVNTLKPFVKPLQAFAQKSRFREFYKKHQPFYEAQIRYYRDSAGLDAMSAWLNANFPDTRYHSFKIIFSPLVSGNQSANWFESNGFKEAQAHVNYPYTSGNWLDSLSVEAANVKRSNIVFTELNHAFINPEQEKTIYEASIAKAFNNMNIWARKGSTAANYYGDKHSCFAEYMNWGLVSLRYSDQAPEADQPRLLEQNNEFMVRRGFTRFPAFAAFLTDLYRKKPAGTPLANLYPAIFDWCVQQDNASK